jgi:hypothetical protein
MRTLVPGRVAVFPTVYSVTDELSSESNFSCPLKYDDGKRAFPLRSRRSAAILKDLAQRVRFRALLCRARHRSALRTIRRIRL